MRTWLAVFGLFGMLLTTVPDVAYGGSSQAGQVGLGLLVREAP
jgi:hypothetical protein